MTMYMILSCEVVTQSVGIPVNACDRQWEFRPINYMPQQRQFLITVKPRFTNTSDHEQFGLRTNFMNTKRLG